MGSPPATNKFLRWEQVHREELFLEPSSKLACRAQTQRRREAPLGKTLQETCSELACFLRVGRLRTSPTDQTLMHNEIKRMLAATTKLVKSSSGNFSFPARHVWVILSKCVKRNNLDCHVLQFCTQPGRRGAPNWIKIKVGENDPTFVRWLIWLMRGRENRVVKVWVIKSGMSRWNASI